MNDSQRIALLERLARGGMVQLSFEWDGSLFLSYSEPDLTSKTARIEVGQVNSLRAAIDQVAEKLVILTR